MPTKAKQEHLVSARRHGIETCGRIVEFWGFTRSMGRCFGLLYLSPDPLPQSEIQKQLGISAGNASMSLAALLRWGVVHKIRPRGERRDHYRAETDFWKMIANVLNERERKEIARALESVSLARTEARAARRVAKGRARRDAVFLARRLAQLDDVCRLGETMLDMLLGNLRLDIKRFRGIFAGS